MGSSESGDGPEESAQAFEQIRHERFLDIDVEEQEIQFCKLTPRCVSHMGGSVSYLARPASAMWEPN